MCRPSVSPFSFFSNSFFFFFFANLFVCYVCAVKKHPNLKSRYKRRVEVANEYAKMIKDFEDLVDLRTLACHCLGLKPSSFVLCAIEIEEKSKCSFSLSLTWIFLSAFIYLFIF